MDITDTTQKRFEVAIELFVAGESVAYKGVLFWRDRENALHINSYSNWAIENTTVDMAEAEIARAKEVLAELTVSNLEVATIRRFQDRPQTPTMSNKALINRNTRT